MIKFWKRFKIKNKWCVFRRLGWGANIEFYPYPPKNLLNIKIVYLGHEVGYSCFMCVRFSYQRLWSCVYTSIHIHPYVQMYSMLQKYVQAYSRICRPQCRMDYTVYPCCSKCAIRGYICVWILGGQIHQKLAVFIMI